MCTCPAGAECGWFCSSSDCYAAIDASQGPTHACAVLSSGDVICWGQNQQGQLGTGETTDSATPLRVEGITDAIQVSVGFRFSCALRQNGSVSCWGSNTSGALGNSSTTFRSTVPVPVTNLTDATQIDVGISHACAVRQTGAVVCWGDGGSYRLGNASLLDRSSPTQVIQPTDATQVTAAWEHTCALRQNGEVVCWGDGGDYRLGDGSLADNAIPDRCLAE